MKTTDEQRKLNNLYHRYQLYDRDGTNYSYDIYYTTLQSGQQTKCKRNTGLDKFREHINDLIETFDDVVTIIIADYSGKSAKSKPLNDPIEIRLLDVNNEPAPKVIIHNPNEPQAQPNTDVFAGFAGFAGMFGLDGNTNPNAIMLAASHKMIDDKHVINRLTEVKDEQTGEIAELRRKLDELQQQHDTLNDSYEELQDEAEELEEELERYRDREFKQDKIASLAGAVLAKSAKNFLRENPAFLSGFIPPEQLGALLSDDEPAPPSQPVNTLSPEEQERMDDATIVLDWLQTLENEDFEKVISIIAAIRKNTAYADRIIEFLSGKTNHSVETINN